MANFGELAIYATDEMVDRAWAEVSSQLTRFRSGDDDLDRITNDMVEHVFRAGWLACLRSLMESENRKDGIG